MWIFKWIAGVLVFLLIIGFALQNQENTISLVLVHNRYVTIPLPVWVVVYVSFGAGVLFWLAISIFQVFKLKAELRRTRKENQNLRTELDNLRNLSIEGDLSTPPVSEPPPLPPVRPPEGLE